MQIKNELAKKKKQTSCKHISHKVFSENLELINLIKNYSKNEYQVNTKVRK